MKKLGLLTLIAGVVLFSGAAVKSAEAACGSTGGTSITTVVSNSFLGVQKSKMNNFSGGNLLAGNIGSTGLSTGTNTSTSTQVMSGINTNTVTTTVTSGGTTNNVSLVNTGNGVFVCASASN